MKNTLIFAVSALLSFTAAAAETILFEDSFDNAKNWFQNGKNGKFNFSDAGKTGKCLNIINADNIFMCNISKTLTVKNGAVLKISFDAKGSGSLSINPMGRDAKGLNTQYLAVKTFKIATDKWQIFSYELPFAHKKNNALAILALRLNFYKNCNIMMDNFKITAVEK